MASEQSFKNQFLIAMPSLKGGYFESSVSILVDHNEDGAMGLIVNRPLDTTITEYFPEIGDAFECPVMEGGPVRQESMVFLHEGSAEFEMTFHISEQIYMTTSRDFIDAMRTGRAPARTLALVGYAGWGPLQLEDEIARDSWLLVPVDDTIVFDTPPSQRLDAAAQLMGVDMNLISSSARPN